MLVNLIRDCVKMEKCFLNFNSFTEIARHNIGIHILSVELQGTHLCHDIRVQSVGLLAVVQLEEGGNHLLTESFIFLCNVVSKMQSKVLNSRIRRPENLQEDICYPVYRRANLLIKF